MSYIKSQEYPNWIYDDINDTYISPSGRLAYAPGSPFEGQLSKEDFKTVQELAEDTYSKGVEYAVELVDQASVKLEDLAQQVEEISNIIEEEESVKKELTAEVVKTIRIGDLVTIRLVRVS